MATYRIKLMKSGDGVYKKANTFRVSKDEYNGFMSLLSRGRTEVKGE